MQTSDPQEPQGTEPTISLCMITRNEERFLADCLASVRDACFETIVVDTGSTDRTIPIAHAAGARVLRFAWSDDFSAARNVGVEAARGSHILVLDADERLAPGMKENLLRGARNPELLLGCLPLYNASTFDATATEVLEGTKRIGDPVFVPRLFRNLPEMRFERRVHETLTRGFNDLQARGVGHSIAVGAALVHYGDVPSHRVGLAKDDRNVELLRRSLEDDPADGEVAGYLVVELLKRQRASEAREVGERHFAPFLARNDNRPAGWLPENMVRIGYALGLAQCSQGAFAEALDVVHASQRHTPDGHPNLDYVEGLAEYHLGHHDGARRAFERAIEAHGRTYAQPVLPAVTNEMPRLKLAGIELMLGRPEAALDVLPDPASADASRTWAFAIELVRAEADLALGQPAAAMERLAPFVDAPGLAPDWHALVHHALSEMGKSAENLAEMAAAAERSAWLEPRRAALLPA